ncbi:hypothetical protein O6H91_04G039000 [Diphasiastrum complanatum]|uniref:Uncharacterized protein n=1 Tax=Diphasiastrum complanatum TaxID=34168 RepID=A0ACC2DVX3_DIPCM|nr:hypothetical protein O6H91_04G039000 [Diphasiastrum complanatum]
MAAVSRFCHYVHTSPTAWEGFVTGSACGTGRPWPSAFELNLAMSHSLLSLCQQRFFSKRGTFNFTLQEGLLSLSYGCASCKPRLSGFRDGRVQAKCQGVQTPLDEPVALQKTLTKELSDYTFVRPVLDGSNKLERTDCIDVAVLGNLCLDIVLNVPSLPPNELAEKYKYMQRLVASPPDEGSWEAGGNSNFAIAASRLGLRTVTIGHVGHEKFGQFLVQALEKEGITVVDIEDEGAPLGGDDYDGSTLLCWVLVDQEHNHSFCSRFDFMKDPVFSRIIRLPARIEAVIKGSKALFCNGFVFDELLPATIESAVDCAQTSGSALFFDPGPKGKLLSRGTLEQQAALEKLLRSCDVLLLTADEAEALTGVADPLSSSRVLLSRCQNAKWVIVKLGEKGCLLATLKRNYRASGFKVDVIDTVGCGDSFAAAIVLGYIHNIPVITTITLANAVGAATAKGCGAGRNVATASKVADILACLESTDEYSECSVQNVTSVGKENDGVQNVTAISIEAVAKDALDLLHKVLERDSVHVDKWIFRNTIL